MRSRIIVLTGFLALGVSGFNQGLTKTKWWNPATSAFNVIEGQGWTGELANAVDGRQRR